MREAKKSIIKKAENERDIFSDNSDTKERRSATNAIKNLFSSKKRKNDSADVAPIDEENAQSPTLSRGRRDTIIATSPTAPSTDVKHAGRTKQPSPAQVAAEHNGSRKEPEDGNYKSALQEYVQKNVRSATVMLEYKDTKSNGGCITEIYLFGRKIAKADGANKKESSQNAAKAAYHAITASSGDTAEWFKKIKNNPDTVVNVSATPTEPDYISELNRIYQKKLHRSNAAIKYVSAEAKTKGLLAYAVVADDERLGFGKGKTAREAKQNAAKNALEALEKNDNINFRKSK